ncbi:MAG: ankyrin repeat domain-containing protein, partial [Acidimicrobiales bacterium]
CFAGMVAPGRDEVTNSFWSACHGGQLASADFLLARGADLDWIGHDNLTPLDAARRRGAADVVDWLQARGAKSATRGG